MFDGSTLDDATNPTQHTSSLSEWRVCTASQGVENKAMNPMTECRITESMKHTARRATFYLRQVPHIDALSPNKFDGQSDSPRPTPN